MTPGLLIYALMGTATAVHTGWESCIEDGLVVSDLVTMGDSAETSIRLAEQEFYEEARQVLYQATRFDQGLPVSQRRRSRMLLAIIQNYDRQYSDAEALLKDALGLLPPGEDEPQVFAPGYHPDELVEIAQRLLKDANAEPIKVTNTDTAKKKPSNKKS